MQHVPKKWLSILSYILIAIDFVLLSTYGIFDFLNVSSSTADQWGITLVVMALVVIHALYAVVAELLLKKKHAWIIYIINYAIFAIMLAIIIEASGNTNILYRGLFTLLVFGLATLGPLVPLAASSLSWILFLLTLFDPAQQTNASPLFNTVANTLVSAAGIIGWFVFRRYYIKDDRDLLIANSLLAQEQFKANVILESITDGVIVVNTKGTIQVLNQAAATMLGWTTQDATKLDYKAIIQIAEHSPQDNNSSDTSNPIEQTLQQLTPTHTVVKLKTRNERQLFIDIVASPVYESLNEQSPDEERKLVGVIAVLRDVDQQKKQEQQRSDFVSTASHEMRTPVASIQGFIELALNKKVATIDDKARGYLEKAYQSTQHLSELFQDLLTVSKSDDGRLSNNPQLVEVNQLLSETIKSGFSLTATASASSPSMAETMS